MSKVSTKEVLMAWRNSMRFADEVRLVTGERGNLVRQNRNGSLMVLAAGDGDNRKRHNVKADMLFPGWWPDKQFAKAGKLQPRLQKEV